MDQITSLYEGTLLRLYAQRITLPNGARVSLEVIRHPGAALIIPFVAKDAIVMLIQFRPVIQKYLYELPAGTLNQDESALACARRELIEETGYTAKEFKRLGVIYPVPGYSTEKITMYKAMKLKECERSLECDEIITTKTISRHKAKQLFKAGKIIDAKTICALALCGWL